MTELDQKFDRPPAEERIPDGFVGVVAILSRRYRFILASTALGLVSFAAVSFLVKPKYKAEIAFIPPSDNNTFSNLMTGQAAAARALGGFTKSPTDMYVGILESDNVGRYMVHRFQLQSIYKTKTVADAVNRLRSVTVIKSSPKDSIVHVSVIEHDPVRARDLANGYLDAIAAANAHLALTEAGQRRQFFEKELAHEKSALADAEVALKQVEEKSGVISPAGQANVNLSALAETRAQIASREVRLSALMQGATEENPAVISLRSEIANLRSQLGSLSSGQGGAGNVPTHKVPEIVLDHVRKERDVKFHEALMEILFRQYEAARLDEAKEGPDIQILDSAVTPETKDSPQRKLYGLTGLILGLLLSTLYVLLTTHPAVQRATDVIKRLRATV